MDIITMIVTTIIFPVIRKSLFTHYQNRNLHFHLASHWKRNHILHWKLWNLENQENGREKRKQMMKYKKGKENEGKF